VTLRWLIGLAANSRGDKVAAALIETKGAGIEQEVRPVWVLRQPYPRDVRDGLAQICASRTADLKQVTVLHRVLGESYAAVAHQIATEAGLPLSRIFCLGLEPQIMWREVEGRYPSILPLGMAAAVAEQTGITTLGSFAARDLVAGGQGTGVTDLADFVFYRTSGENRLIIHLGEVVRLVLLPANGRPRDIRGFEAGPCNILLDGLIASVTKGKESFDPGGRYAVQGKCHDGLLGRWLSHPYYARRPPKSVPRADFGREFVEQALQLARQEQISIHDVLCTATHLVARGVTDAVSRFLAGPFPHIHVLVGGGGARNGFLLHLIQQGLVDLPLESLGQSGFPADGHRALATALLAALALDGVAANLPGSTGARSGRVLGSITPGSPANWARCIAWMAGQMTQDLAQAG
jgi:anhydro-N-acetylmuramic acid kinase